jgi:hypothetical protein
MREYTAICLRADARDRCALASRLGASKRGLARFATGIHKTALGLFASLE